MKLFDSHCHLNDPVYSKDFDLMLQRMNDAEVAALMIVGINKNNSASAVALAESYPQFYVSVGIHPHDADTCSESALEYLKNLAKNQKVKAWGETGLDFNRMYSPKSVQEKWFIRQIETAEELNLPLIFHERDSKGRFLEILKSCKSKNITGVVHCFSGSLPEMNSYINMGLYIGITGILTIKTRGADLRQIVKNLPADRILIETDAPYLTPAPQRNKYKRNEPAFVRSTLLKLAEVRNEEPEILAGIVWENTCRLYNI
ncbi:Hydrolase, TatD-like [Desulfonema limicola]|uniref:Hydrolase, TatD-like n=1 Tax=Desulfonema limicola TaxID=45656 RepID=A0A975B3N9_9BACT|nr:TatD family hydrolase [Desulfonema limicola]QTA78202.1 Hydrolase, TatD-like [Desulfonema limicola]